MNKKSSLLLLSFLLTCFAGLFAQSVIPSTVSYISPKPGSFYNNTATEIHINFSKPVSFGEDPFGKFLITGPDHQPILYTARLADKRKVLLLKPLHKLPNHQSIKVSLSTQLKLFGNQDVEPFSFSFATNVADSIEDMKKKTFLSMAELNPQMKAAPGEKELPEMTEAASIEYPQLSVTRSANPSPGHLMMTTLTLGSQPQPNYLLIEDNFGKPVYIKQLPHNAMDFKKHNDSTYSYYDQNASRYYVLDGHLNVKDTVAALNGYILDNHELLIDKNGDYYHMAEQYVNIDMSTVVPGGHPQALVMGMVIQKQDRNGNLLFEWKSLDHIPITQAIGVNLTAQTIDYVHSNALEFFNDSSILLSSRHLNEITKISLINGQMLWRMGASAVNQFSFPNDSNAFSYQHDIRKLPNGNLLLFDNGNFRTGARYSRAVEYQINEQTKVATMVWEYRNTPDVESGFLGSVQRLPNGNTVIGWGGTVPTVTEVDMNKNVLLEMTFAGAYYSYRVRKYDLTKLLADNQLQLHLPDTTRFCNISQATVMNNLPHYLDISSGTTDSIAEIIYKPGNAIHVNYAFPNGFLGMDSTVLVFGHSRLMQKDTMICNPSAGYTLSVSNQCANATYLWSNNETGAQINIYPDKDAYYWVDIINGTDIKRDSIYLKVSELKDATIYGINNLVQPYEIHTYSIPFFQGYDYDWEITNGNIISGFGTNAVRIQWGANDTGYIRVRVSREICAQDFELLVLRTKGTGIDRLHESSLKVNMYPNPAQNTLFITGNSDFDYHISDMAGRQVAKGHSSGHEELDISGLPKGIYSVSISSGSQVKVLRFTRL